MVIMCDVKKEKCGNLEKANEVILSVLFVECYFASRRWIPNTI
jgi:hypothetical protein